jgi:hypothetical protein
VSDARPEPEPEPEDDELTPEEMRRNVLELVFGGDESKLAAFCDMVRGTVPAGTEVVLRGSAVTGRRWKNGEAFDARGRGTSDLDLTLVGAEAVNLFKPTGFFVPLVHSRPVSEKDPDIAPELTPLRDRLMAFVGRPVNIQATREFVMHIREDMMRQPYLVLIRGDEPR